MDTRDRGPACELIALHLAEHFGISHLEPAAVTVHPDLAGWLSKMQPDLMLTLNSSRGPNFGTRLMIDVTIWPTGQDVPLAMQGQAAKIFAFDALISNDDRRIANPNLLVRGDEMFVIDHEAAFSFLYVLGGRTPQLDLQRRRSLRDHVFFYQLRKKALHFDSFVARLADLSNDRIERILREVPEEWKHSDMGTISTHLQFFRENCAGFDRQLLEVLT
jgi:hypothetical protein